MKKILIIVAPLFLLVFAFQCGEKKPNNPQLDSPSYFYPINLHYKWNYVLLNVQCLPSEEDSFALTVVDRKKRPEGSGWDIVTTAATGATTFVYQIGDTMFSKDVRSTQPPYKILVGPVKEGTFWRDTFRGYEYHIVGFEDIYSPAAGGIYNGCAKVRRTTSGDAKITYFWWAPQIGMVKREEKNQSGQCISGEELKRLDKSPDFP